MYSPGADLGDLGPPRCRIRPGSRRRSPRPGPPSSPGPTTPPCSSTTMASFCVPFWNSLSRSDTFIDSGTKIGRPDERLDGRAVDSFSREGEEVLGDDHALDVVEPVPVDRDARVLFGDDEVAELLEGRVAADADHVHPRGHDLADERVAELDDAPEKLVLVLLDDALLLGLVDEGLDLVVARPRGPPPRPPRSLRGAEPAGRSQDRARRGRGKGDRTAGRSQDGFLFAASRSKRGRASKTMT